MTSTIFVPRGKTAKTVKKEELFLLDPNIFYFSPFSLFPPPNTLNGTPTQPLRCWLTDWFAHSLIHSLMYLHVNGTESSIIISNNLGFSIRQLSYCISSGSNGLPKFRFHAEFGLYSIALCLFLCAELPSDEPDQQVCRHRLDGTDPVRWPRGVPVKEVQGQLEL